MNKKMDDLELTLFLIFLEQRGSLNETNFELAKDDDYLIGMDWIRFKITEMSRKPVAGFEFYIDNYGLNQIENSERTFGLIVRQKESEAAKHKILISIV